jgi:hypothetical protein
MWVVRENQPKSVSPNVLPLSLALDFSGMTSGAEVSG